MLNVELSGYELTTCIYNASGPRCTTESELNALGLCPYNGIILTKSCTLKPREGNVQPRYYETDKLTINSTGLANEGYEFYGNLGKKMKTYKKPYFISVSGLSMEDNLEIISYLQKQSDIDGIELNLSCPNIVGKTQIGYDYEATNELLRKIYEKEINYPIGLKLPPYFEPLQIENMSDIFKEYPINFLTCINSLGNGLVINPDTDRVAIKPKGGLGGIGGEVIKPFALANVYQFKKCLSYMDIIGCGGIQNGQDIYEHILVGATAVQIGSALMREGVSCFERLTMELKMIMNKKGYNKLSDFRANVKTFDD